MVAGAGVVVVNPSYLLSVSRSIIPKAIALGCAGGGLSIVWTLLRTEYGFEVISQENVENSGQLYSTFSFALGFLCVWRNGNAFSRWWDGIQTLATAMTEWLDACSQIVAATGNSKNSPDQVAAFNHVITRLFSLMTCLSLKHVSTMHNEDFAIMNLEGLDNDSLQILWTLDLDPGAKMVMVSQWILNTIHKGMADGVIAAPAPIVSRVFQELANGTFHIEKLAVISNTEIPQTYSVMVNLLLIIHIAYTSALASALFEGNKTFMFFAVFLSIFVLWCINFIAVEIEHPFGDDHNDIDVRHTIHEVNDHLRVLLDARTKHTPTCVSVDAMREQTDNDMFSRDVFDPEMEEAARLRLHARPSITETFVEEVYDKARNISRRVSKTASDPHGVKRKGRLTQHPARLESKDTGHVTLSSLEVLPKKKVAAMADGGVPGWRGMVAATVEDAGDHAQWWRELAMEMQRLTAGILQQLAQQSRRKEATAPITPRPSPGVSMPHAHAPVQRRALSTPRSHSASTRSLSLDGTGHTPRVPDMRKHDADDAYGF